MLPSIALQTHREAIRQIALKNRVTNVRVFRKDSVENLVEIRSRFAKTDLDFFRYSCRIEVQG